MPDIDPTPFTLESPTGKRKLRCDVDRSDITGQVFGAWTVIGRDPEGESNRLVCRCTCGIIKVQYRSVLARGKSRGCRACYFKWKREAAIDMTGEVHGSWTVIEKSTRLDANGQAVSWVCRCLCGVVKSVTRSALIGRQSTQCKKCQAKYKYELPTIGERSGSYTVVEEGPRQVGGRVWLCRCDCGAKKYLNLANFRSTMRQKCCVRCSGDSRFVPWKRIFNTIKRRATDRGHDFDLTIEFLEGLIAKQGYKCALSGVPIHLAGVSQQVGKQVGTASLDRIDSLQGYIKTNVQFLHKSVNAMKMDSDQDEFIASCARIAAHAAKKKRGNQPSSSEIHQPSLPLS
jgi:hypothetical protein